ncbi:HisA/HisF-related TIM barrel protein [Candidatus Vidania fulgoroideorum]
MIYKRLIACLDINKEGNLVKGKKFINLYNHGNPFFFAKKYYKDGIDEIIILNINKCKISVFAKLIKKISKKIFIPISVGGNIKNIRDIKYLFNNGADKIVLNSTLFYNLNILKYLNYFYGKQSVILSVDVKFNKDNWYVYFNGGKTKSNFTLKKWITKLNKIGIGEILITSIDNDGLKNGYDLKILKYFKNNLNISVIISGGGNLKTIILAFKKFNVSACLIASLLHENILNVIKIKNNIKKFKLKYINI